MLSKEVFARAQALLDLRERYGDNLVDRWLKQFGYTVKRRRPKSNGGKEIRYLSEEDHNILNGIISINDGYYGWIMNADVSKFAHYCSDEIVKELEARAINENEGVGTILEQITNDSEIVYWLIKDSLDRKSIDEGNCYPTVSSKLGYWMGQNLVSAYQDFYYEAFNYGNS